LDEKRAGSIRNKFISQVTGHSRALKILFQIKERFEPGYHGPDFAPEER
jgi:hypothetical protein